MPSYHVTLNDWGYNQNYDEMSGTSMACPYVSGLAGLLLSKNDSLTPDMIKTIIKNTCDETLSDKYIGRGRINAYEAIQKEAVSAILNQFSLKDDFNGLVNIKGSAWGVLFQRFIVDYGKGLNPNEYIEIINSTTQVQNGVLASIDASLLDESLYIIRLRVICEDGIYQDTAKIVVNNIFNTIFVGNSISDNINYTSIKEAVLNAGHGDEIRVYNGVYNESLIFIYKSISIYGENINDTIINGSRPNDVIYIETKNVKISNITIKNGEYGIVLCWGSNNNIISNCILSNNFLPIYLEYSYENIIENCVCKDNRDGIQMFYYSFNNEINNCSLFNNYWGNILIQQSPRNKIINCVCINSSGSGIKIGPGSSNSYLKGNIINNCKEGFGIGFYSTSDLYHDIDTSNMINGKPIYYLLNQNNLTFDETKEIGFLAFINCTNILVKNINLSNNFEGLLLANVKNATVNNSDFSNCDHGIWISNSNNVTIKNCSTDNNYFFGIWLENTEDSIVENCKLSNNGCGIYNTENSNNNKIKNCILDSNYVGIDIRQDCNYNEIKYCKFTNNKGYGLRVQDHTLYQCNNNSFHHNIFINNTINSYDPYENFWDDNTQGNFWDDYTGADEDNDGIGDTPYDISGGDNQDRYPLGNFDQTQPEIIILKPQKGLYLFNHQIRRYLIRKPLIIGKINITVNVTENELGIQRVEFYINDVLKANDTTMPYNYIWDEKRIFKHKHKIKITAYDKAGNSASEEMTVWKFL